MSCEACGTDDPPLTDGPCLHCLIDWCNHEIRLDSAEEDPHRMLAQIAITTFAPKVMAANGPDLELGDLLAGVTLRFHQALREVGDEAARALAVGKMLGAPRGRVIPFPSRRQH